MEVITFLMHVHVTQFRPVKSQKLPRAVIICEGLLSKVWRSYASDLGLVPATKGIYVIGNVAGEVLYLGHSMHLRRRLNEHKYGQLQIDQFVKQEFAANGGINLQIKWVEEMGYEYEESVYLDYIENRLGYCPQFNIQRGNTAFTATEAWRNPTYLEENITMFDQNLIFDEVMQEMITVESEPTEEQLGDDENDEFQDKKEGHSRDFSTRARSAHPKGDAELAGGREAPEAGGSTYSTPAYVQARGPKALAAYRKAVKVGGSTYDKRVKILLVGQDRVGKTSVGKSLRGELFDKNESSTDGVQMIPRVKNAGTEAWRNPSYLKENITMFDEKIVEKVTQEILGADSQPMDEEQEHSGDAQEKAQVTIPDIDASFEELGLNDKTHRDDAEMPPEIVPLLDEQLNKNKVEDEKIWAVIWDFAGQDIYRAIHPIFMSAEDIYLLVFVVTKKLSDKAECRVNRDGKEYSVAARDSEDTNLDHMMRWMDLIHSLVSPDDSDSYRSEYSPPPVIVVGTHAACVDPNKDTNVIGSTCQGFPEKFRQHIVDRLPIDNTKAGLENGQEKIVKLREKILDFADQMPHTKKKIPLQWHRVEKEIIKEAREGKKYLPKKALCEEIASQFCKFDNEDDFDELLYFLHARGSIVYHEHSGDKDGLVILDPQWLITVLCEIVKVEPCVGEVFTISQDRVDLQEKGILRERLLDHACRKQKLDPIKDSLVSLMEKFNLICKWPARETGDPLILVPCMLTTTDEEGITADEMKGACPAPLYLTFPGTNYVPSGLFCRLVVLFGKWLSDPQYTHEYKLYANKALFALDQDHFLHLVCYKTVIKFRISEVGRDCRQSEQFVNCLSHLKQFLETLKRECHWLHSMTEELRVLCTACLGMNPEPCLRHDRKGCQHHDCAHYIPLHPKSKLCCIEAELPLQLEPLKPWIEAMKSLESTDNTAYEDQCSCAKRKGESPIPSSTACKKMKLLFSVPEEGSPSCDELERLSRRLVTWQPLAHQLGFHEGEVAGFDFNNRKLDEKVQDMLFKWKMRDGSGATYKVLCEKLCHELVGRKDLAEELASGRLAR